MSQPLKGKSALITGSTSGIGLGLAEILARNGANILLNGFGDVQDIEESRKTLEATYNVAICYSPADMTRPSDIRNMVQLAKDRFGTVDILINNAGIQHVSPIEDFSEDKWDAILAINLSSNFHTIRAVLPMMRDQGFGRIINIASAHGLVASPFKSAYVAAKHGVIGLTKTVGLETAQDPDITCNAICPGYVRTPLVDNQIKDQARAHSMSKEQVIHDVILASQPNKRFVEIEELGALTLYLCSEQARSFNGACLPIDGGWTAR